MKEMREATVEERKRYYRKEWSLKDLPDYVLHSLSLREFGFDHDGSGPSDRYNQFMTPDEFSDYLKDNYPYAVYGSVAFYEKPSQRKKWLKSELAFDIDAKDLPFKSCNCTGESVCELCLNDARRVTAEFGETLSSDLGLEDISYVYSGRGFHIRVSDDSIMKMGQATRSQLVEYITGNIVPPDVSLSLGYPRIFRKRVLRTFGNITEEDLVDEDIRRDAARKIMEKKDKVKGLIKGGELEKINDLEGIGSKYFKKIIQLFTRLNSEYTDGKVTIDKKRILRVPSSLHSTVSRKCTELKDIDNFSLDEAVPQFLRESG